MINNDKYETFILNTTVYPLEIKLPNDEDTNLNTGFEDLYCDVNYDYDA